MREALQPSPQIPKLDLNPLLEVRGQTEEDGVEFAGVKLRGLVHGGSAFADARPALAQVGLAAFDAGDELRVEFGLIFKVVGQPVLKLQDIGAWQMPHLGFNGFQFAHGVTFSARPRIVKPIDRGVRTNSCIGHSVSV